MVLSLLALAIAPGLAIAIYVFWMDKFEREPLRLMVVCFVLGALSIVPAALIENWLEVPAVSDRTNLWQVFVTAYLIVGLTEEGVKFLVLYLYAYPKKDFNEPFDGITYSVMVSMGFATLENILYVLQGGYQVGILRMFTAVPAHASFAVLMGYFVGLSKFRQNRGHLLLLGLVVPIIFHGTYDFFLLQKEYAYLTLGGFGGLLVGIILSRRAIRLHQQNSPFRTDAGA
jgi:RsiW-degrading membrane proteinase PrsW (M82 family)